jgi:hypothetical protein
MSDRDRWPRSAIYIRGGTSERGACCKAKAVVEPGLTVSISLQDRCETPWRLGGSVEAGLVTIGDSEFETPCASEAAFAAYRRQVERERIITSSLALLCSVACLAAAALFAKEERYWLGGAKLSIAALLFFGVARPSAQSSPGWRIMIGEADDGAAPELDAPR